jgi:hypothetical protein
MVASCQTCSSLSALCRSLWVIANTAGRSTPEDQEDLAPDAHRAPEFRYVACGAPPHSAGSGEIRKRRCSPASPPLVAPRSSPPGRKKPRALDRPTALFERRCTDFAVASASNGLFDAGIQTNARASPRPRPPRPTSASPEAPGRSH